MLVGPESNPAGLDPEDDDILTMFNKMVTAGNADTAQTTAVRHSVHSIAGEDEVLF